MSPFKGEHLEHTQISCPTHVSYEGNPLIPTWLVEMMLVCPYTYTTMIGWTKYGFVTYLKWAITLEAIHYILPTWATFCINGPLTFWRPRCAIQIHITSWIDITLLSCWGMFMGPVVDSSIKTWDAKILLFVLNP